MEIRIGKNIIPLKQIMTEIEGVLIEYQFVINDPDDGHIALNGVQLVEYLSSTDFLHSGVLQIQTICKTIEEHLILKYGQGEQHDEI